MSAEALKSIVDLHLQMFLVTDLSCSLYYLWFISPPFVLKSCPPMGLQYFSGMK